MNIAGVVQVLDEVDIIECTVRHMLSQGVDQVWAMDWGSTDGTLDVLGSIDEVTLREGEPTPFYWSEQGNYNTRLGNAAHDAGADWIVPFDADEYWTGTNGRTIREAIEATACGRIHAKIIQYADFDHRSLREYPWTKVAYRWHPTATIVAGNHLIKGGYDGVADEDALLVHELKFRGYEHFERKVRRVIPWNANGDVIGGGNPSLPTHGLVIGGTRALYFSSTPTDLVDGWIWLQEETEEWSIPSECRPCLLKLCTQRLLVTTTNCVTIRTCLVWIG